MFATTKMEISMLRLYVNARQVAILSVIAFLPSIIINVVLRSISCIQSAFQESN